MRKNRPMASATSIDGTTFSFHAPVDGLELQPGSYASVGEHLGQVHTVELMAEERGSVHGRGMLLEGGVAPFHDVTIGPAESRWVAVRVQVPFGAAQPGSHPIHFEVEGGGARVSEKAVFLVPR